ncbi:MAG: heparinase II/III family protein [Bacteroidales bacterium]|nr:heparinase II/III family protein [Bacteroidales bacterium]
MNRFLIVFSILLITTSLGPGCKKNGPVTLPELPGTLPAHPRILMLKNEEKAIRQTITTDNSLRTISNFILSESDKMIAKAPVERVLIGKRLLDKSREALRRIFFLSYSWRMTSDSKYLDRAEKEMLAVSAFSDWNPSHFLDVAEMTMGVSIGYDWLYYELSDDSRKTIRKAIIEKGLKPSLNSTYNWFVKSNNNWNQVCNGGMTFGALAVYEDEKELADQMIERALSSIKLPLGEYEPDGAYPEGFGYWGYGTGFHVMLVSALQKAYGDNYVLPVSAGFLKTAGYYENMTGPTGKPFNYSDNGTGASLNPAMFWFVRGTGDPTVLYSEKYHLLNQSVPNDRLLPAILLWCSGISLENITPPDKNIWVGQGKNPVAVMRTSWTDPNAIYVGLKAGTPSANHGHMDVGTFVMDANGERWAADLGADDYNSLETAGVDLWNMSQNSERWGVFRYNNLAHNTLTVNGLYQKVAGSSSITGYSDQSDMLNAVTDMTTVYNGQLKKSVRGIAVVDNKYTMVRDEVETLSSETIIRWNLVTSATVTITGSNSAELVKNNKKLILKVVEPGTLTMKTWSTAAPNSYEGSNKGTIMVGFETTIPANSSAILTVLLLPEGAKENTAVTAKKISEWPNIVVK